ncbi:MAG: hypothetical protein KGZ69_06175 [Methylomonas sp.]|nr:hypothetical protein [Methylomonas sp.]
MTRMPTAMGLIPLGLVILGVIAAIITAKQPLYDDGVYSDSWYGAAIEGLPEQKREASLKVFEDLKKLPLDSLLRIKVAPCYDLELLDCRGLQGDDVRNYVDIAMERFKFLDAAFSRYVALCSLGVSFVALVIGYFKFRLEKPR